jgi:hypothetical protein
MMERLVRCKTNEFTEILSSLIPFKIIRKNPSWLIIVGQFIRCKIHYDCSSSSSPNDMNEGKEKNKTISNFEK